MAQQAGNSGSPFGDPFGGFTPATTTPGVTAPTTTNYGSTPTQPNPFGSGGSWGAPQQPAGAAPKASGNPFADVLNHVQGFNSLLGQQNPGGQYGQQQPAYNPFAPPDPGLAAQNQNNYALWLQQQLGQPVSGTNLPPGYTTPPVYGVPTAPGVPPPPPMLPPTYTPKPVSPGGPGPTTPSTPPSYIGPVGGFGPAPPGPGPVGPQPGPPQAAIPPSGRGYYGVPGEAGIQNAMIVSGMSREQVVQYLQQRGVLG